MKEAMGFLICFGIGLACRIFDIPSPAPQALTGIGLIFFTWLGYTIGGW